MHTQSSLLMSDLPLPKCVVPGAVKYSTIQCSVANRCAKQQGTTCAVQCSVIQFNAIFMQYSEVQCRTMQCLIVPYSPEECNIYSVK